MKVCGNGEYFPFWIASGTLSWTSYSMGLMGFEVDLVVAVLTQEKIPCK